MIKKIACLILSFILAIVTCGCASSPSPTVQTAYIRAEILDASEMIVYSSNTDITEVPVLNLQNNYYLRLHIGPGARFLSYEFTKILFNRDEIMLQELEEREGQLYSLQGIKECKDSKLEIAAIELTSEGTKIQCTCTLSVSFLSGNSDIQNY